MADQPRRRPAPGSAPSHHDRTVRAIRRIIRAVDMFSHKLETQRGVTVPQLSCLLRIVKDGPLILTTLVRDVEISASTAVGIIDRLERKGLVKRIRSEVDRRQVLISATPRGLALVKAAPSPLQDRLASALEALPELEQTAIALSLERIVSLMGIENVEASPILDTGISLTADPRADRREAAGRRAEVSARLGETDAPPAPVPKPS